MATACPINIVTEPKISNTLMSSRQNEASPFAPAKRSEWYAIRTRPRHEKLADATLRHKGFDSFLPLYRRRRRADRRQEISIPVFPGYLFCRFDRDARLPILTTPGVL